MKSLYQVLLASAVALCATVPAVQSAELVVGFTRDADTLDPANHRNRETETIIRNMYDGIMTRDGDMKVVPEIAESVHADLAHGLRLQNPLWHQVSRRLRSDCGRCQIHAGPPQRRGRNGRRSDQSAQEFDSGPIASVEVIDGDTVRINQSEPWPILPAMLPFQEVVSKAFVEKVGTAGMATQENGTGPFKLVDWRKGDAIIMERFDDYYGGSTDIPPVGKACVDRVIFKVIPESASRVAALLAGDVDIINELPTSEFSR